MALLVTDPELESRILSERQESGGDRFDEVWDGLYIAKPLVDNEHQDILSDFLFALVQLFGMNSPVQIRPGVNVSDRNENWTENYRCPDVVVFLPGTAAINRDTHWQGGPDFLVEIVIDNDRSREKIPFYASVGVREALFINRKPWSLELYRKPMAGDGLELVDIVTVENKAELRSEVLPIMLKLARAAARPKLIISSSAADSRKSWTV